MSSGASVQEIVSAMLSNPVSAVVIFIQFLLGLAIGYLVARILKYVLAILGILVLGTLLSVWSFSLAPEEVLSKLGVTLETLKNIALAFAAIMVGPIAVGFVVGILVGLLRK